MLSKLFGHRDTIQFPNRNKLPFFLFKAFSDFNSIGMLEAETFALSSVSSRLPVIPIRKLNGIPEDIER